jgi:hypothetical protein
MVPTDEEGGFAVLPAFKDVRAAGFLTHGMQALVLDQSGERKVFGTGAQASFDPLGFALNGDLGVAHFKAEQLAPLRIN